ncbi:MAG: hypothetical protein M1816_004454 [Peltula sp. TS41687]|nr:MAG: hypothetical protein M1816_004454 [Peltula sp. TS41687]
MAGWRDRLWGGGGSFSPFGSSQHPAQVSEDDYSYITAEDLAPPPRAYDPHNDLRQTAYHPSANDDIIILRSRGNSFPAHFTPYSIDDGLLTVADLRMRAANMLGLADPARLKMLYKGRTLKDDKRPCREEGLKINSEVLCVLSEEPVQSGRGQEQVHAVGEEDGSESERDDSSAAAGDGTSKRKRNRNRKKKTKKSETNDGLAPPDTSSGRASPREVAPAPKTALDKLEELSSHFSTKLLPPCVQFTGHPPADPAKREFEHRRLSETILSEVLLKLDAVETEGDPDARQRRKDLVKQAQEVLSGLDAVLKGGGA